MPTLGLRAYNEIRRMLVHGRLQPGMQLVNRKLADEIGMSMTPVREAVARLASEGFIDHVPGAGAFVRRMSPQQFAQLYDVRRALEPLAAAEAAAHATPAEIAELQAIAADSFAMIRVIAATPGRQATPELMARWIDGDQRFHEVLFQAARNRWLSKIAVDLKLLAFGFAPQRGMPEFLTVAAAVRTWRGHRRLLRALARRDAELAATTIRDHIHLGREEVLAHLATHGGSAADRTPAAEILPRVRPGRPRKPRAFTLVELLIVIAIIVLLIGLLFPAIQMARGAARRVQCANNLVQMGRACVVYENSFGALPAGAVDANQLSWRVLILPYIEQRDIYDRFDFSAGLFNGSVPTSSGNLEGPNRSVHALNRISTYQCPDATRIFATDGTSTLRNPVRQTYAVHYFGVGGPKGTNPATGQAYPFINSGYGGFAETGLMFYGSRVTAGGVRDGMSNTLLAGESAIANTSSWTSSWWGGGDGGNWVRGTCCASRDSSTGRYPGTAGSKNVDLGINAAPLLINDLPFGSFHVGGGAHFVRGDGSVEFINENIDISAYKSLCTRAGGETNAFTSP